MKKSLTLCSALLGFMLFMLVPTMARAADCDAIATRTLGDYTVESLYLLDSDTVAATGTSCDTNTWGAAAYARISMQTATACSETYKVTIYGRDGSATLPSELAKLDRYNPTATLLAPLPRYLYAVSTGMADCSD